MTEPDAVKITSMDDARAVATDFVRRMKGQLRFAVRGPKGHSTIWTAFGRGNDFYIGARPLMGSTKISLHASGICRVALTEQHYNSLATDGLLQPLDRAMVKWKRAPTPTTGAILVASIVFPSEHLLLAEPTGTYRKPIITFGEAPIGKAIEFGFFYSQESMSDLEERFLKIGEPVFGFQLENGTIISLVARVIDFDKSALPSNEQLETSTIQIWSRDVLEMQNEKTGLTGMFWNSPEDGQFLRMYEIGGMTLRRPHSIDLAHRQT